LFFKAFRLPGSFFKKVFLKNYQLVLQSLPATPNFLITRVSHEESDLFSFRSSFAPLANQNHYHTKSPTLWAQGWKAGATAGTGNSGKSPRKGTPATTLRSTLARPFNASLNQFSTFFGEISLGPNLLSTMPIRSDFTPASRSFAA